MANNDSNGRPAVVAVMTAGFLMFGLGLTHRALPVLLLTPTSTTPINPDALERFPVQIGDWVGQDIPLDESILGRIHAEAYVNRRYLRAGGGEPLSLFIAASGTTVGPLVGHPPEACNACAGGTLVAQSFTQLPLGDGMQVPCQVLQFVRGDSLTRQRVTVLYYYMADDQYCGNRSELRSRVRRGSVMVRCVAQVQIVASANTSNPDSTTAMVRSFAVDSASAMARLFANIRSDRSSSESCEPLGGR